MKISAGTLLFKRSQALVLVLLVHPSGNYNAKAPWSIPKGLPDEDEVLESAARRETLEETGVVATELFSLGFADYRKSAKRIHCFAGSVPETSEPRCASWEVDQAEFMSLEQARARIHPDQAIFLSRLEEFLLESAKS